MNEITNITEKLQKIEERKRLALEASYVGIWDWDIKNDILHWDKGMFDIYQISQQEFNGDYKSWSEKIHPEDLAQTETAIKKCLEEGRRYFYRFRVKHSDEWRVVSGVGNCVRNEHGEPIRMVGINILEPEPCKDHPQRLIDKNPCEICPSRWQKLYCEINEPLKKA